MRTVTSIIHTIDAAIDAAIADYELSADAMRWTPDPSAVPAARIAGPSPEQIEAAREAFARFGAYVEQWWKSVQAAMRALAPLIEAAQTRREQEHRQRLSRIRRDYGSRRR